MICKNLAKKQLSLLAPIALALLNATLAVAQTESVIYSPKGGTSDGASPYGRRNCRSNGSAVWHYGQSRREWSRNGV